MRKTVRSMMTGVLFLLMWYMFFFSYPFPVQAETITVTITKDFNPGYYWCQHLDGHWSTSSEGDGYVTAEAEIYHV